MESSLIQICEQNVSKKALTIKDKGWKPLSFMERETRLELATSSLARKHSTTELPPHKLRFKFLASDEKFNLPPNYLRSYYYLTCSHLKVKHELILQFFLFSLRVFIIFVKIIPVIVS